MSVFLYLLSVFLVIVGLVGTFIPVLPGVPLLCGGLALIAWIGDFSRVSVFSVCVIVLLGLLSYALDFIAASIGVKRVGASKRAVAGSFVGSIGGCFLFPPFGLFVGPFIGAFVGELTRRWPLFQATYSTSAVGTLSQATKVGMASFVGTVAGVVAKLGCVVTILGFFLWVYFV